MTVFSLKAETLLYEENFDNGLSSKWRSLKAEGGFSPNVFENRLRLTNTQHDLSTAVTLDYEFPTLNNKFVLEFDYLSYGGCSDGKNFLSNDAGRYGADGLSIILFDSSVGMTPTVGASGGSLGYSSGYIEMTNGDHEYQAGFQGGWLGIGLDEFGCFKVNDEGRKDIHGLTLSLNDLEDNEQPNSVAIRGMAANGYRLLASSNTLDIPIARESVKVNGKLFPSASTFYESGRYRLTVDSTDANHLYIKLERKSNSWFSNWSTIINQFDAMEAQYNQGAKPEKFRLAFSSGTGGGCNNHEIDNVKVYGQGEVYTEPTPCTDNPTTIDKRISSDDDDVEERVSSGSIYMDSSDLEMTEDGHEQVIGLRFTDLQIPKGATISNAYLEFEVDERSSENTTLTIFGENSDHALMFIDTAYNVSNRPKTSTSVVWSPPAWNNKNAHGEDQQTPELKSLVQEIVNRAGWNSGHSMVFMISGTGKRVAESYDGESSAAPLLHIEYTFCGELPPSEPTSAMCYALTDNDNKLYKVNMTPNASPLPVPQIINISDTFNGEGSAYRASNNKLYAFQAAGDDVGPSDLYTIDVGTGAVNLIKSSLLSGSVDGAEFYYDSTLDKEILYILSEEENSKLYAFYADTWLAVSDYPKNINGVTRDLSSLAIDPITGDAYAFDDYNYDNKNPKIYKLNLKTATTKFVVQTQSRVDAEGLAYASDGNLYLEDESYLDGRKIYKIDLITGALTPSAELGGSGDVEGLSCNGTQIAIDYPTLRIDDVQVNEGNNSSSNITFIVTLDKPAGTGVSFKYQLFDGNNSDVTLNAYAPSDYHRNDLPTAVLLEGDTQSYAITVPLEGDYFIENNETLNIILTEIEGAITLKNSAIGTIIDDDNNPIEPILEYRFDECWWDGTDKEVKDSSTNSLHGTAKGAAKIDEDAIIDKAGLFDGNGDYIEVKDNPKLNPDKITIMAWVKPEDFEAWDAIAVKVSNDNWDDGWGLAHFKKTNDINFFINNCDKYAASTTLELNKYSHVVGTYDGSEIKIYIDGVLKDTTSYSEPIKHSTHDLWIGQGVGNSSSYGWDGNIDEVKMYDKAFSLDEINSIYENEKVKKDRYGNTRTPKLCPAPGAAFSCTTDAYVFSSDAYNTQTDFSGFNLSDGTQLTAKTNIHPSNINAIGYNVTDNYIWGYDRVNYKLVRVDSNYETITYDIAGLPTFAPADDTDPTYHIGDVSLGGILHLATVADPKIIYRVDLNYNSINYLKAVPSIPLSGSLDLSDFAFSPIDNLLYGVDYDENLIKIDQNTGVVTNMGHLDMPSQGNVVSVFFDKDGNMYAHHPDKGDIYKITPPTTPGSVTTTLFSNIGATKHGDGARCPNAGVVPAGEITPIAEYRFDECAWDGTAGEVKDNTISGLHGTAINAANTDDEHLINRSANLNAVAKQYVEINGFDNIFGATSSAFTFTTWLKPSSLSTASTNHKTKNTFMAKASDTKNDNIEIGVNPDGTIHLYLDTKAKNADADFGLAGDVSTNNWHFVSVSYDNGVVTVRINDKTYTNTTTWSGATVINQAVGSPLTLGSSTNIDNFFDGFMDEVKVFDYALSQSQLNIVYNNEVAGKNHNGTTRNPVLCTPFQLPKLSIDNVTQAEGDEGETTFNFTVTADKPFDMMPMSGAMFYYKVVDGNGEEVVPPHEIALSNDHDFKAQQGIGVGINMFGDGVSINLPVIVYGDKKSEKDEEFFVEIYSPQLPPMMSPTFIIDKNIGVGVILNDDENETGDPFTCSDTLYLSNRSKLGTGSIDSGKTWLHSINRENIPYSFNAIGTGFTSDNGGYNAMGYNIQDHFIYGMYGNILVKIDSDGVAHEQGEIEDFTNSQRYTGEFDRDGFYYVTGSGGNDNQMYKIDITQRKVVRTITLSQSVRFWDMAIDKSGKYFYTMLIDDGDSNSDFNNGKVAKIEIATGDIIPIGNSNASLPSYISLVFSDKDGDIFMMSNENGFYKVDITTGKPTLISSSLNLTFYNDGTSCPDADIPVPQPIRPIANYHFDECLWDGTENEVKDQSENNYHGKAKNSATTDNESRINRSAKFEKASSQYVEIDGFDDVFGTSSSAFTFATWINPSNLSTAQTNHKTKNTFMAKASDSKNDNIEIGVNPDGTIHVYLDTKTKDKYADFGLAGDITTNSWHFVSISYDNGIVMVRIDDKTYTNTATWAGATIIDQAVGSPLTLGSSIHINNYFDGFMDEVKIFDIALSTDELSTIYTNESAAKNSDGTTRATVVCTSDTELIAEYRFDKCDLDGLTVEDSSDNNFDGTLIGNISTTTEAVVARAGRFEGGAFDATLSSGLNKNDGAKTTVSFWMNWNGSEFSGNTENWGQIPISWGDGDNSYNLHIDVLRPDEDTTLQIGFNTYNSDNYGVDIESYAHGWHHIVAVFNNGDVSGSKLFIDGIERTLEATPGRDPINSRAYVSDSLRIGGLKDNSDNEPYAFKDYMDEIKIYSGELTSSEITTIYNNELSGKSHDGNTRETLNCSEIKRPVAEYRLDECSWDGVTGEVKDSSGIYGNGTSTEAQTLKSDVINRAAYFDTKEDKITIPHNPAIALNGDLSISFWIKPEEFTPNGQSLLSKSATKELDIEIKNGYIYFTHEGKKFGHQTVALTETHKWYHLVIIRDMDSKTVTYYIDNQKVFEDTFKKTDIHTSENDLIFAKYNGNAHSFVGSMDEIKIFNVPLTAEEIDTIYTNEFNHLNYDGTAREKVVCEIVLEPFSCDGTLYLSNQSILGTGAGQGKTWLHSINRETSPHSYSVIGGSYTDSRIANSDSLGYNALAYNVLDDYMYALHGNNLLKIGNNAVVESLGLVAGLSPKQLFAGEFDRNGNYYATGLGKSSKEIYKIDINNQTITETIIIKDEDLKPLDVRFLDMAIDTTGENFYVMLIKENKDENDKLAKINIKTGILTTIGDDQSSMSSYISLIFSDIDGDLYIMANDNGFCKINPETGERYEMAITQTLTFYNDGASCGDANVTEPVSVRINDVSKKEGDSGTTDFTFRLTFSEPTQLNTGLWVRFPDGIDAVFPIGTAGNEDTHTGMEADFRGSKRYIAFPEGINSYDLTVEVLGDMYMEGHEEFYVDLYAPTKLLIMDSRGVGTILNDDMVKFNIERTGIKSTPVNTQAKQDAKETLFTQIAGRDFDYTIVSYDKNSSGFKEFDIEDITLKVELIDYNSSVENEVIYSNYIYLGPKNSRFDVTTQDINQLKLQASRNVGFVVSYLEHNNTLIQGNFSDGAIFETNGTEFVKRTSANDNFSIRPLGFKIMLSSFEDEVKTPLINNYSDDKALLAAGHGYELNITAMNYVNSTEQHYKTSPMYNMHLQLTKYQEVNASLIFDDKQTCRDKNNSELAYYRFTNGEHIESNFKHSNVGKYQVQVLDTNWTNIDYSDYNDQQGCIVGSSKVSEKSNERSGCDISSEFTIEGSNSGNIMGAAGKYQHLDVQFKPYSFDLSDMNITSLAHSSHPDFLYMSDLDVSQNMAIEIKGEIRAKEKGGKITTNFTNGCQAGAIELFLDYTGENNKGDFNRTTTRDLNTTDGTAVNLQRVIKFNNEISTIRTNTTPFLDTNMTIEPTSFKNENNGTVEIEILYNIQKNMSQPINPIKLNFQGINALEVKENISIASAQTKDEFTAKGKNEFDNKNYTFYFAKVAPNAEDYPTTYGVETLTPLGVEIFCDQNISWCTKMINMNGRFTEENYWYTSINHIDPEDGTVFDFEETNLTIVPIEAFVNGRIEALIVERTRGTIDLDTRVDIRTNVWLRYHKTAANGVPFWKNHFKIPKHSNWSGLGNMGNSIDSEASAKTSNKMDW